MSDPAVPTGVEPQLGSSARSAVIWGGGFTLIRDIIQFGTMLILVRILLPEDYGSASLAQTVLAVIYVVSFGALGISPRQLRDPDSIDWQLHFTAGAVINGALFLVTLAAAWSLTYTRFATAALPLAIQSLVFLVEVPGLTRHRMLLAHHDWKRFRLLLLAGGLLGSIFGIAIACLGGGVWALSVQPVFSSAPTAIEFFFLAKWRPVWTFEWSRFRETALFGLNRMGSGLLGNLRQVSEQVLLAGIFSFATLGVVMRSIGLANVLAGRFGAVIAYALFPVVTRAKRGSAQFQRYSGLVLQAVVWVTVPGAALLSIEATDVVSLLYGPNWNSVTALLPLACVSVALVGVTVASNTLLLANEEQRKCLELDAFSAVLGIVLAALLVRYGEKAFLIGLALHGVAMLALTLICLVKSHSLTFGSLVDAFVPAMVAGAIALGAVAALGDPVAGLSWNVLRLSLASAVFSVTYLLVLRLVFVRPLTLLLEVAPASPSLKRILAI